MHDYLCNILRMKVAKTDTNKSTASLIIYKYRNIGIIIDYTVLILKAPFTKLINGIEKGDL